MGNPDKKVTIIGGGIVGALEAYYAIVEAKEHNEAIRITLHEKNATHLDSTAARIAPSKTVNEIMAVVPRGNALVDKLGILFSEPGGIRVDDVRGVNDTKAARVFIAEVKEYGKDDVGHEKRSKILLEMGKKSMAFWQQMYDSADAELKHIFENANFQPCREPKNPQNPALHDGYRIDLIYKEPEALKKAEDIIKENASLGFAHCKMLTPDEVVKIDPYLKDFCQAQSECDPVTKQRVWKKDAQAVFRPGGCIDISLFLPPFYEYLAKIAGTYRNKDGKIKDNFRIKMNREVIGVDINAGNNIESLVIRRKTDERNDKPKGAYLKRNTHYYRSDYVFCPGEAVGTLEKMGFEEPAYARFPGVILKLKIEIPEVHWEKYRAFNHPMEVYSEGIVLAWQARANKNGKKEVYINVAGTKAFYGEKEPTKEQAFAKNRNLLQLNKINDVLPELMLFALNKNTKGIQLTQADMTQLEKDGIAFRNVGTRAVAYDGFPTLGRLSNQKGEVYNARVTTHLGSGGVSFGPAAVLYSRSVMQHRIDQATVNAKAKLEPIREELMEYAQSTRSALKIR